MYIGGETNNGDYNDGLALALVHAFSYNLLLLDIKESQESRKSPPITMSPVTSKKTRSVFSVL